MEIDSNPDKGNDQSSITVNVESTENAETETVRPEPAESPEDLEELPGEEGKGEDKPVEGQGQEEEGQGGEETQSYYNYEEIDLRRTSQPVAKFCAAQIPQEEGRKRLNFFKGCKWAPDGSCLLSNADDDVLRLFNVPGLIYQNLHDKGKTTAEDGMEEEEKGTIAEDTGKTLELEIALKVKEGGQVYDYCWYPLMSSFDPVSCCFATASADSPVHLWDAFTGRLRASYLPYDHLDQVVAPRSVAFDPTGDKIYCGFNKSIRTFNLARPGRHCVEWKLKHSQFPELSQPGIVSCIATNPALRSVLAVGSYLKTVGLYQDDGSVLGILQGHLGGVTQIKFTNDGTKLISGGRKDSRLIVWDMRYMGEKYLILKRAVSTNQRIYFDVTMNDKFLVSGGTDGCVKVWDLKRDSECLEPVSTFSPNRDCVNGISVNPFIPLLATSSGQRHLPSRVKYSSEPESGSDSDQDSKYSSLPRIEEKDIKLFRL